MTLENVFYTMGIIFMSLSVFILIAIVILLFYIKKKVTSLYETVERKIEYFTSKPSEIAAGLGAMAADAAIRKVKKVMGQ